MNIETLAAKVISYIFHPALALFGAFLLIISGRGQGLTALTIFPLLLGIFLPPAALIVYKYIRHGESIAVAIDVPERADRNRYYAVMFVFEVIIAIFYSYHAASNESMLYLFQLAMLIAIYSGLMYSINRFFDKASQHAATYTFVVFLIAHRISFVYALALLALPIIFWARLKLRKHTWLQLLLGTVIGCVVGLVAWTF